MSAVFWILAALMLLLAMAFLLVPLRRARQRSEARSPVGLIGAIAVAPVAVALYFLTSSYDATLDFVQTGGGEELAMLEQLAERLGEDPDNVDGWILLGRSYLELGEYPRARQALQEAWNRSPDPDPALKLYYAEALLLTDPATALTTAGTLLDEVLAVAPDNQRALWWGGLVAAERNDMARAVERWTALLATNPPPQIAALVQEQMAGLAAASGGVTQPAARPGDGPKITLDIAVAENVPVEALGGDAIVYLLARPSGATGGPPLAAKQVPLSALPGRFELGVADAMMAGLTIEAHQRVTVVARISLTGEPTEQPGDIYGETEVDVASGEPVSITIETVVPRD